MKVLNFIPFVAWAIGFLALAIWEDHLMMIDGRGKRSDDGNTGVAQFYVLGLVVFALLGIFLSA